MTPVALGHHCAQCNRLVLDFTTSTQADLTAAFRNSPDGRVCGRFRPEQLAPRPLLRQKLRRFLVALVLVCGLGLSGQEVLAQVRKSTQQSALRLKKQVAFQVPEQSTQPLADNTIGIVGLPESSTSHSADSPYTHVEQMPQFKGGAEAMQKFIAQHLRIPSTDPSFEGRVFVKFIVTKTGSLQAIEIAKGLYPSVDTEALRVVGLMNGKFEPGRQSGQKVDVYFVLPLTFQKTKAPSSSHKK